MPVLARRTPTYRLHKARGCAVVTIDGKNHYLGPYGSPQSCSRYEKLIEEWAARNHAPDPAKLAEAQLATGGGLQVSIFEVAAGYLEWAKARYVKQGEQTGYLYSVKSALRVLTHYGELRASEFNSAHLTHLLERMVTAGRSRCYVNAHLARLKRVFKWARQRRYVTDQVLADLAIVEPLEQGRTVAREPREIPPVADHVIAATVPFLSPVVRDMVAFQRLTGARPGEVCNLRPCDVDRGGEIWVYRPHRHKTQHKGKDRLIHIGPKAQAVLLPYLLRDTASYCFSPAESVAKLREGQRARRRTKVQPSQVSRKKERPKLAPGKKYRTVAYALAVRRAADKAERAARRTHPEAPREVRLVPHWAPNQLRHARATEVKSQFSLEAAAATLGHARLETTQRYAKLDYRQAAAVAAKIG